MLRIDWLISFNLTSYFISNETDKTSVIVLHTLLKLKEITPYEEEIQFSVCEKEIK